jgi:hypothetical protein
MGKLSVTVPGSAMRCWGHSDTAGCKLTSKECGKAQAPGEPATRVPQLHHGLAVGHTCQRLLPREEARHKVCGHE